MPNHMENIITLKGDEQKIREMLETIQSDDYGLGTVDFNKITPMPECLSIEAGSKTDRGLKLYKEFIGECLFGRKETDILKISSEALAESEKAYLSKRKEIDSAEWELGKTAWNNIQKYGFPTWYEWSINNWGTKWNAYGYDENTDYSTDNELWFQTAWSAPHPILQKLSEMYPSITFEHQWADEDLGMNCGRREYLCGEIVDEYIPEGISATEFALEVWDYDPAELGMAKNSTETEYICVDCEKYELIELFGKPALFSSDRITPKDIPQGIYCYDLRHSDDCDQFSAVEPKVTVNHGGSVITNEPLDFGENGYISFNEESYPNFTGNELTMGEYMYGEFKQSEDESQKIGGIEL